MEEVEFIVESNDQFFVSPSQGLILVDSDGAVWECDLSGYRITDVPEDAIRLVPVAAGAEPPLFTRTQFYPDTDEEEIVYEED
jgi:hypothetical protein